MKTINLVLNDMEEVRILLNNGFYNLNTIKYPSICAPSLEHIDALTNYNVFYHGLMGKSGVPEILSDTFIDELDLEATCNIIEKTKTKTLSFHIGNEKRNIPRSEMLSNLKCNYEYLKENLPLENIRYISLENMEANVLKEVIHPSFINEAIELTCANFLLDITHAYIAANILRMNPLKYILSLPLDKVKELHFSGTAHADNKIYSHIMCRKEDYDLLKEVLPHLPNLEVFAIEYGTPAYTTAYNPSRPKFGSSLPRVKYGSLNNDAYYQMKKMVMEISSILNKNGYYVR